MESKRVDQKGLSRCEGGLQEAHWITERLTARRLRRGDSWGGGMGGRWGEGHASG